MPIFKAIHAGAGVLSHHRLIAFHGGALGFAALALRRCHGFTVFVVVCLAPARFPLGSVHRSESRQTHVVRRRAHSLSVDTTATSILLAAAPHHLQIDWLAQRGRIPRNDQQHAWTLRRHQAIADGVEIVVIFEFDNLNGFHTPMLLKPPSPAAHIRVHRAEDGATSIP
jgi:hypothetical protein